ncbi:hypothetical protein LCM27_06575 [Ruegeria marisrubri]|uniref:hypothetical protein n=1 Tax=Ruegeria marisrubri TaxID=1685379 RepID=UPI001CD6A162|nr:hypothetical protein [Ruegeria marisrubri]MCA0906059.1 hypothetical protein [Ruegeria marisrubri]
MTLTHFANTQDAIAFAIDEKIADLREEHAAAVGSLADQYTDDEFYALENKIDDLLTVARSMGLPQ